MTIQLEEIIIHRNNVNCSTATLARNFHFTNRYLCIGTEYTFNVSEAAGTACLQYTHEDKISFVYKTFTLKISDTRNLSLSLTKVNLKDSKHYSYRSFDMR